MIRRPQPAGVVCREQFLGHLCADATLGPGGRLWQIGLIQRAPAGRPVRVQVVRTHQHGAVRSSGVHRVAVECRPLGRPPVVRRVQRVVDHRSARGDGEHGASAARIGADPLDGRVIRAAAGSTDEAGPARPGRRAGVPGSCRRRRHPARDVWARGGTGGRRGHVWPPRSSEVRAVLTVRTHGLSHQEQCSCLCVMLATVCRWPASGCVCVPSSRARSNAWPASSGRGRGPEPVVAGDRPRPRHGQFGDVPLLLHPGRAAHCPDHRCLRRARRGGRAGRRPTGCRDRRRPGAVRRRLARGTRVGDGASGRVGAALRYAGAGLRRPARHHRPGHPIRGRC